MKKHFLIIASVLTAATAVGADLPEWQDKDAFREGQLEPHALVVPYAQGAGAEQAIRNHQFAKSPYYLDLNGKWDFKWVKGPQNRPVDFYKPEYSTASWDKINVPGNWETQGYGTKIYVNERYEFGQPYFHFKKNPPYVPVDSNEVGSYRREFTVPAAWDGRRVVLCVEGAASFYYIWVNGQKLGYNMGSKTAAEWDITDKLVEGANTVALEVYRWSSGAYLECQDMWRLSGIERDVYLYSTPKTYVADYRVVSPLDRQNYRDGELGIEVDLAGLPKIEAPTKRRVRKAELPKPMTVEYALYDADAKVVASQTATAAPSLRIDTVLPGVHPWSAENPYLYTLVMQLKNADGTTIETLGCNVGFKTSEIKDKQFCLNGRPILIKGVNRHAFTPERGHTVSRESMLRDIELMKRNNINTVRNCHYPMDREWYHLCDVYGIYVIDEANVESHGMGYKEESLAKDPSWLPAHLDRTKRMYAKSKNNPSVTFYSLGNEAGNGVNFEETYKWMKSVENNRPIQYERALSDYNTDVYAHMYRPIEFIRNYCHNDKSYRPYILCEYAHAMGNSVGGLKDYMEVFEEEPMAQGGCIWDWVDQAFIETDANGCRYYTYGGDYGPKNIPSDGSFCCNGLVNSDRTPHPHLSEVKAAYRYIKSKRNAGDGLQLTVKNWYDFTNLSEFDMNWAIVDAAGTVYDSGIKRLACAPGESITVDFPTDKLPADASELYLNIDWLTRKANGFVPAGYAVAEEQFVLESKPFLAGDPVKLKKKGNVYTTDGISFTVSPETGAITALTGAAGTNLLATPLELSLYRPLTENDAHSNGSGRFWREAGLDGLKQTAKAVTFKKNVVTVDLALTGKDGQNVGTATMRYTVRPDRTLAVECNFAPDTATVKRIPRVGLACRIPEVGAANVSYLGRGPVETYIDRNTTGRIARYNTTPEADFHYYIVPQSTGNHTDVRYVDFNDGALTVHAGKPFQFSAVPYSDANIDAAKHINELSKDGLVTVHLDAEQTGVGTATCGPDVLPKYRIPVEPLDFTFYLTVK